MSGFYSRPKNEGFLFLLFDHSGSCSSSASSNMSHSVEQFEILAPLPKNPRLKWSSRIPTLISLSSTFFSMKM